jgi:hypothetical protein
MRNGRPKLGRCRGCKREYMRSYQQRRGESWAKYLGRYDSQHPKVSARVDRASFEALVRIVGWKGVGPTVRRLVQQFVRLNAARSA